MGLFQGSRASDPVWSPQQEAALLAVEKWLSSPSSSRHPFYLAGYAGTGKTTLAKHFASSCEGMVLFGAYTGKAALVMRRCGCRGARTLHQLIYKSRSKSLEQLRALRREYASTSDPSRLLALNAQILQLMGELNRPEFTLNPESMLREARLLIVDECSMVGQKIGTDLLSFGVPILVLGDPAQLPPVGDGTGFFTERTPDIMLTEIHRQARDNPIIRMATDVREGRYLAEGSYGDSLVVSQTRFDEKTALGYDQWIAGTHGMKHLFNGNIREELGRTQRLPEEGDRLVCYRNNHGLGILNGEIWNVLSCESVDGPGPQRVSLELSNEEGNAVDCESTTFYFLGGHPKNFPFVRTEFPQIQEFDFGYTITCHKSQGSQWPAVGIYDESRTFEKMDPGTGKRWLYTAITRASEKVVVVRPAA